MKTLNIAKDYTSTPGGRFKVDGQNSGEEFRLRYLDPLFSDANSREIITIILDGSYGYPTSFLEEAFGGLARKYGATLVEERLKFISNEEPALVEEIYSYIRSVKT
jgi:hypothetical protein